MGLFNALFGGHEEAVNYTAHYDDRTVEAKGMCVSGVRTQRDVVELAMEEEERDTGEKPNRITIDARVRL